MNKKAAIVGMACRVPGASTVEHFWDLMMGDPSRQASSGTLEDIHMFDAGFFGISPRVACAIDPQQRLLLEVTHEAIEDAGVTAARLAGSRTGVFVAQHASDYDHLLKSSDDHRLTEFHAVLGASRSATSGRISYAFDLRGPSLTVDTACSSSLVAMHLALRSMEAGDCELAIVGGVNLSLLNSMQDALESAGIIAADGQCRFGDALADGTRRSEGIAAVLLKPLTAATADGDHIRAVVLGSGINNDGRSSGQPFRPAPEGQEEMLRAAYRDAAVDPADIDYVEAHGAGTDAGDTAELAALHQVLSTGRPAERPCIIGSAKSSVGHTESAAGLIGLIRAVLCLEHSTIPPNPHLAGSDVDLRCSELALTMSADAAPIPYRARGAIVGVSNFGLSGTNAHIVLRRQSTSPPPAAQHGPVTDRDVLLVGSARDSQALNHLAAAYRQHLISDAGHRHSLAAIARFTVNNRDHHEHRFALVARSRAEAADRLLTIQAGQSGTSAVRGRADVPVRAATAFVFSGHGSQWIGMGRELLAQDETFSAALIRCDRAVQHEAGWSVLEHLVSYSGGRQSTQAVVQPVIWAIQVALAEMWQAWGVKPDIVIGHSMGEIAAAHIAGTLSLPDAATVICRRSYLADRLRGTGTMMHVNANAAVAAKFLAQEVGDVCIAAVNGEHSTVLAGDRATLEKIGQALGAEHLPFDWVDVDFPSHSPHVDSFRGELVTLLRRISPRTGSVPLFSTAFNQLMDGSDLTAEYWAENMRRPVQFQAAIQHQLQESETYFVEISPHPLLLGAIDTCIESRRDRSVSVGSLRKKRPERASMLSSLGSLYTAGMPVRAEPGAERNDRAYVRLPTYPWQRKAYWFDSVGPNRSPSDTVEERLHDRSPEIASRRGSGEVQPSPVEVSAPIGAGALEPSSPELPSGVSERQIYDFVSTVLNIPDGDLDRDCILQDAGLDSILANELRRLVQQSCGILLPHRFIMSVSSREIARHVQQDAASPHICQRTVLSTPAVTSRTRRGTIRTSTSESSL